MECASLCWLGFGYRLFCSKQVSFYISFFNYGDMNFLLPVIFGLTGWKSFKSRELMIAFFQFSPWIHMILPVNSSARFSRFPSVITILFRDGKFLLQIRCNLTNIFYEGLVYYIGRTWILCLFMTFLRRCLLTVMMCMRYFTPVLNYTSWHKIHYSSVCLQLSNMDCGSIRLIPCGRVSNNSCPVLDFL